MKIKTIIQFLLILILQINTQNINYKIKPINKDKIPIPRNSEVKSDEPDKTKKNYNNEDTENNLVSGKARGVSFSEISTKYYGSNNNESNSNIFLEYPEPQECWEESCRDNGEQSPINIPYETDLSIIKDGSNVEILSIDYNFLQSGKIEYQQNHMWGLGIIDGGSIHLRIRKKEYIFYLSELYFHLNSEHRLQNKQYPIEMQLVHYRSNFTNNQEKLIISVLFDYSNNTENELLNDLKINSLEEIENVDFSDIIQKSNPFYYYKGGLTIPPCSSNVHWIIFRDIHNMSYEQFEKIRHWIEGSNNYYYSKGYGNARGIKPLNQRKIYYESKFKAYSKNNKKENYTSNISSNLLMLISLLILIF